MTTTTAVATQKIQIAIRTTPMQVWAALIDGDVTPLYYIGFRAGGHDRRSRTPPGPRYGLRRLGPYQLHAAIQSVHKDAAVRRFLRARDA